MERVNQIDQLLTTSEQVLSWRFIETWVSEYLSTGNNGQIIIDVQNHRITGINYRAFVSGVSKLNYYLDKID